MEKKVLKKGSEKKICGVCSGLAEYMNVDVTVIRLATVLLSFFSGLGVVGYIVGALIMRERSINPTNIKKIFEFNGLDVINIENKIVTTL